MQAIIRLDLKSAQAIEDATIIKKAKDYEFETNMIYDQGLIDPKDSNYYILAG